MNIQGRSEKNPGGQVMQKVNSESLERMTVSDVSFLYYAFLGYLNISK